MPTKPRTAKPALSLWLVDARKAAAMKPHDVANAVGVAEETVRGWESGRGIGPESLAKLRGLFGEPPAARQGPAGDLAAAITDLVDELQLWRSEDRARIDALWDAMVYVLRTIRPGEADPASDERPDPLELFERAGK